MCTGEFYLQIVIGDKLEAGMFCSSLLKPNTVKCLPSIKHLKTNLVNSTVLRNIHIWCKNPKGDDSLNMNLLTQKGSE